MFRRFHMLLILILLNGSFIAQENQTRYYADKNLSKEVKKEKALYQWETSKIDGLYSSIVTEIATGKIIRSEYHRGDEQVGVWTYALSGGGTKELNYDFDLYYRKSSCAEINADSSAAADSAQISMPVPDPGGAEFMNFLLKGLTYPTRARDMEVQGRSFISFTINESGLVEDPHVVRSAHIMLDKEAVRVIREARFTVPPMKNGKPSRMCFTVPVSFVLR